MTKLNPQFMDYRSLLSMIERNRTVLYHYKLIHVIKVPFSDYDHKLYDSRQRVNVFTDKSRTCPGVHAEMSIMSLCIPDDILYHIWRKPFVIATIMKPLFYEMDCFIVQC